VAGIDWQVIQEPLQTVSGIETPLVANLRNDNNTFLGAVTGRYRIVQNKEAFDFMDELSFQEVVYETTGVLGKGEPVWLLAKMNQFKVLDDDVTGYLCLNNSHDGKGAIRVSVTPVKVVCQNTLNLAIENAKRTWTIRHMGDFQAKKLQASQTLGLYENYILLLNVEAEELVKVPLNLDKASNIIEGLFPMDDADSDRKIRNIKQ